jgi:two-component system sensor histidine kinase CpxA
VDTRCCCATCRTNCARRSLARTRLYRSRGNRRRARSTTSSTAVEIAVSYENDVRQFCRIGIRDRGDGVPETELEQIFEPFYRLEGGASPGSGRSGIGLAIARRAVHRHGGEIAAANAAGGGLEVSVTLPVSLGRQSCSLHA